MTLADDIRWFKTQFGAETATAIAGTPFTLDLIVAIAIQETHEVWGRAYKTHSVDDVLRLCVGDIIDGSGGRGAFPRSRTALEGVENGKEMFTIARQAIVDMATVATEYQKYLRNPSKFAHAFGIFQRDIQEFTTDPDFFLQKQWYSYTKCLEKCLAELEEKRKHVFGDKTDLSDSDLVYVAIAYNKGSAHVGAGFKQGFKSDGKYYGELIDEYMRLAKAIGGAT
jgi:hypothetical protein